jgi:hypothetical protein
MDQRRVERGREQADRVLQARRPPDHVQDRLVERLLALGHRCRQLSPLWPGRPGVGPRGWPPPTSPPWPLPTLPY